MPPGAPRPWRKGLEVSSEGSESSGVWVNSRDDALVTWARMLPGLFVLNPCRTLSATRTRHSTTVAYATTQGHLIAGCELLTVRMSTSSDAAVSFELLSRSRGAGFLGRAIFPLLAPSQSRFFREQCRCMEVLMESSPRARGAAARVGPG